MKHAFKFGNILIATIMYIFLSLYGLAWCLWLKKDSKVLGLRIRNIAHQIVHFTD